MNKAYIEHLELLKSVPEVKESIEELKMGTYIIDKRFTSDNSGIYAQITLVDESENFYYTNADYEECGDIYDDMERLNFEIIGLAEERHLRMFFKEKDPKYTILDNGIGKYSNSKNRFFIDIQLDNSKPYHEQSVEFFEKLNEWIRKEFNL